MFFALLKGNKKIENLLLEHGTMNNEANFKTVLSTAMKNRKFAIVEQLLEKKYFIKDKSSSDILSMFLENSLTVIDNVFLFIREYKDKEYKALKIWEIFLNKENPFYLMESLRGSDEKTKVSILSYIINKVCGKFSKIVLT